MKGKLLLMAQISLSFSEKQLTTYRRNDVGFVFPILQFSPKFNGKENVELASQIVADALDSTNVLQSVGLGERLDNFSSATFWW